MDRDTIVGGLVLFGILALVHWRDSEKQQAAPSPTPFSAPSPSFSSPSFGGGYSNPDRESMSRDEAIDNRWDEIKDFLNGSESVEACSSESGSCYDLDADISNGTIDTIHFLNGGYKSFGADIDESGSASDSDDDGNSWDFTLDMNSSIVDDAVQEWANSNGVTIQ